MILYLHMHGREDGIVVLQPQIHSYTALETLLLYSSTICFIAQPWCRQISVLILWIYHSANITYVHDGIEKIYVYGYTLPCVQYD